MNDPQEFVFYDTVFDNDKFVTYHLGNTPQVYKAKKLSNFSKVNIHTKNNVLDFEDICCYLCGNLMCYIYEDFYDDKTRFYASKVMGFSQLCDDCAKILCKKLDKDYKTFCHHMFPFGRVHRSGIYVKTSFLERVSHKNTIRKKCRKLQKILRGNFKDHIIQMCQNWLY